MKNLFLLICSTLLAIGTVEIALRVLNIGDPPIFRSHLKYGYLMRPNQLVSTRGHQFHINSAGFRGVDFAPVKPTGFCRIAFVGDSITYGGGSLSDEELFVNRVPNALRSRTRRRIETINMSSPGWGVQNMAAYIEVNGFFEADAVIWVLPEADFRRPKTSLEEHNFPTEKPWSRFFYLAMVGVLRPAFPEKGQPENDEVFRNNVGVLVRTLRRISEEGARIGLVVIPSEKPGNSYFLDVAIIRSAATAQGIPFLDTAQIFERRQHEDLFIDSAHLSRRGHEVIAEVIEEFLSKKVIPLTHMPCESGQIAS